jgi:drug/metabolite transporter (DMT)-like permease
MKLKTITFCSLAMIAFAANSVLCRMALKGTSISPLEFTAVRLIAGCLILLPILLWNKKHLQVSPITSLKLAIPLFTYALFFSLAYINMGAGVGALILFAAVQITMIGISIAVGNRLNKMEWCGFVLAFAGLIYLLLPGLTSPPILSAALMLVAGISWGVYSVIGKGVNDTIAATRRNFLYTAPLVVSTFLIFGGVVLSKETIKLC